jgi:hypothetical protein
MDVTVDATGQQELAGNVDDLLRIAQAFAEGGDAPAANADIAGERVGRGRDRAAA